MSFRATILPWILAAALPLAAEAQIVLGHLVEDGSDDPIVAATVRLLDEHGNLLATTLSDSAGHFLIKATGGGRYRLRAEALGFKSVTTAAVAVELGDQLTVRVVLSPAVVLLAPLEIRARSRPLLSGMTMQGYNERREKGLGFAITRETIENRNARAVTDLLRTVPGVRVEFVFGGSRVSIPGAATHVNGGCEVKVFLDGLEFTWGSTTLDDIPTFDIEAIEVFRSLADMPPELAGADARCGVVAIWTRRGRD